MNLFFTFFDKIKSHNYTILTALVIGLLTSGYLLVIVPNNERKEDANNLAVFKGIEEQLKTFVDDKVKEISPEKMDSIKATYLKNTSDFYINSISIDSTVAKNCVEKKLRIIRTIHFKSSQTEAEDSKETKVRDTVAIDIAVFLQRINAATNFDSFFICPVPQDGKCKVKEFLISENVSLKDQDSLCHNSRNNGNISFKKSTKRYYTDQVKIPNTNFTLFFAGGIDAKFFQSHVQYIKPNIMILGLLVIVLLFLSICFIKPVFSSHKERLSQMDLVTVIFSIGALIGILVVFSMVTYWKHTINARNKSDLKCLVESIEGSFSKQIDTLDDWKAKNIILGQTLIESKHPFRKLYLSHEDSKISLANNDSLRPKDNKAFLDPNKLFLKVNQKQINQLGFIDSYFRMDKDGLLIGNLNADNLGIRRKYADRKYFKLLQNKTISKVVTGVFSRETDEYQWIYAEKDPTQHKAAATDETGIIGIAFREKFSKEIKLPPDTGYMLVDRDGFVLMQNDPKKNLYQNLLLGSNNNLALVSLLSGSHVNSFVMDYQGTTFQVYAKKLTTLSDIPIYVLGIRNLSYLNYLELFAFSNGFLISVLYGFLILLMTLLYSSLLYSGRLNFFSRQHFYHLFPDNSRKEEYRLLLYVNCVSFGLALLIYFFSSPATALYIGVLLGFNTTFVNVIILNVRTNRVPNVLGKLLAYLSLFGFIVPVLLLAYDLFFFAFLTLVATHVLLILYYKNWRKRFEMDYDSMVALAQERNQGVQRKSYLRFLTSVLMNHFVIFPFLLVCAFFSNEINDYANYYCFPSQAKETNHLKKYPAYGCDCAKGKTKEVWQLGKNNESNIHYLNLGFDPPTLSEINKFSFIPNVKKFYIEPNTIFSAVFMPLFILLLGILGLVLLTYSLLNYYSNRFFFYEMMQASYEGFFTQKNALTNQHLFTAMVDSTDIDNILQNDSHKEEQYDAATKLKLLALFDQDLRHEISPLLQIEFFLNSNQRQFSTAYLNMWNSLPSDAVRNVLYDFAQDHFLNYKNKDILLELMEQGIVTHDRLTGRLRIMSYSFRIYIMSKSKLDTEFIKQFETESQNGTFDKLKLPILIIAISFLVLLMYLNKDSYDKIAVMGSSIGSALLLVNKFLAFGKNQ